MVPHPRIPRAYLPAPAYPHSKSGVCWILCVGSISLDYSSNPQHPPCMEG